MMDIGNVPRSDRMIDGSKWTDKFLSLSACLRACASNILHLLSFACRDVFDQSQVTHSICFLSSDRYPLVISPMMNVSWSIKCGTREFLANGWIFDVGERVLNSAVTYRERPFATYSRGHDLLVEGLAVVRLLRCICSHCLIIDSE
jgi:hypothetical protein